MRRLLLLLSILAFAGSGASAQPAKTIPIFWQITKPGTRDTSYLLGTYHLASSERVKKIAPIMRAFRRSKIVVGEMVFDESTLASVFPHMLADRSLKQLLPDSDYTFLDSVLKEELPLPLTEVAKFKPIALYVMLSMNDAAKDDTTEAAPDFASAMDIYFQTEAKLHKKQVIGLETGEEQAAILFDSIPEQRQAQGLMEYMRTRNEQEAEADQLESDYYNGQVQEDLVLEGMEKAERGLLLDNRNYRWLRKLPQYLGKRAFVAVGAGHLGGKNGLVEGLRNEGYMLTPIPLK